MVYYPFWLERPNFLRVWTYAVNKLSIRKANRIRMQYNLILKEDYQNES